MSLGIFRSIRGSYTKSYRRQADRIIRALNEELARRRMPAYHDPDPEERSLRRLPCGNAGASTFVDFSERARRAGLPWTLGALRGRHIALPIPFAGKFSVTGERFLLFFKLSQEFCAVQTVQDELTAIAPLLRIPLVGETVPDEIATLLVDNYPMPGDTESESTDLESERGLWFDLHLACRFALEDKTPVVIA